MNLFLDRAAHPMLISQRQEPFDHPDWIYELKLDGFRCLAYLDIGLVDLRNKRNLPITWRFPELQNMHNYVSQRCILDGEVVVMKNNTPDFYEVQRRTIITDRFKIKTASELLPAAFVAYDCLYWKDQSLIDLSLMQRKDILSQIVKKETGNFAVSKYFEGKGCALYQLCEEQKLEGVVAKRKDSIYLMDKQTKSWIKFKRVADEDYVVAGYIEKGYKFSIILGKYRNGKLLYKGHVTNGVTRDAISYLRPQEQPSMAFFPAAENEKAVWTVPDKVCTVNYMPNTHNALRECVFKGYRNDVFPNEVLDD